MRPEEIGARLRARQFVADSDFDRFLPESARLPADRYWTQVSVAMRVSRWLQDGGVNSVLDVGSGAGKFCVVGALSSSLSYTGVEQRRHLVDVAAALARRFGIDGRASFIHGELGAVDFTRFDALYFYNPFGENIFPPGDRLDDTVETSRARFARDVAMVERSLARMPLGSLLVTYNGCGGRVPDTYDLVRVELKGLNLLRLWSKARQHDEGGYWLEFEETTRLRRLGQRELVPAECVRAPDVDGE